MLMSRTLVSASARRIALPTCLSLLMLTVASAEVKTRGAISRPSYDPSAERVELFQGVEDGKLELKVLPKDSTGGTVFVQNNTEQPLTVDLPKAFVGVHVLKQFEGGFDGGGMMGGEMGGMGGAGGGGQAFGGGMGGGMGGMGGYGGGMGGGMGGMGGGFFSIPPEKVVKVPYKSVCLDHGKPEPHPRMNYTLMPAETYTDNEALRELIAMVPMVGRNDLQAIQAAAWFLDDGMSWQELSSKRIERISGLPAVPYFSAAQLFRAQHMVSLAEARSREKKEQQDEQPESTPVRRTIRTSATAGR